MGPNEECMALAVAIKENWPDFAADVYALAYCIQAHEESRMAELDAAPKDRP